MELNQEKKMNVIIFLTDQERATQHFPENWEEKHLPGLTRLKKNGLTFNHAFTNSCMCSPARSTFMTGFLPAVHGVKYTLEASMTDPEENPQVELPLPPNSSRDTDGIKLVNIATVMSEAGYNVVYKGKWHCSKPHNDPNGNWTPQDLSDYGFSRWNPKDAGADQSLDEAGGPGKEAEDFAAWENDARYMNDEGDVEQGKEGVLAYLKYLKSDEAKQDGRPFCLIISLVNPHDVLFYMNDTFEDAGYDDDWLLGDVETPFSMNEDLDTKPDVQEKLLKLLNIGLGNLEPSRGSDDPDLKKRNYINFYANLIKASDRYLVQVLDSLGEALLKETLIIRTTDHGEMGLAHGGLRQKNFNFYEESIRVPLVFSNPELFKAPKTSDALVSHVDFLPTLAHLFLPATSPLLNTNWQGVNYAKLIKGESEEPVQDHIVFTYDDFQSGQSRGPYPGPPNYIVSIREQRYKFAEYYDASAPGKIFDRRADSQFEMYDLLNDPSEAINLAYKVNKLTEAQKKEYDRLREKVEKVKQDLNIMTKD